MSASRRRQSKMVSLTRKSPKMSGLMTSVLVDEEVVEFGEVNVTEAEWDVGLVEVVAKIGDFVVVGVV